MTTRRSSTSWIGAAADALSAAIERAGGSRDVRVIVLRGAGERAFIGGADIRAMVDLTPESSRPFITLICVPGGAGMNALLNDEETLDFVRRQASGARYVTSVCTGSLVLGAAGIAAGQAGHDALDVAADARAHPDRIFLPDHPLDARDRGRPDGSGGVPRRDSSRQQGEVPEGRHRADPPGGDRALAELVRPDRGERDRDPLRDPERSPCSGTGAAVSWVWRRGSRPGLES